MANGVIIPSGGYIVDSGSNANGSWIKYSDGTMICYKKIETTVSSFAAWGNIYESDTIDLGNFPQAFIELPVITVNGNNNRGGACWVGTTVNATASYGGYIRVYRATTIYSDFGINLGITAIGRWKA